MLPEISISRESDSLRGVLVVLGRGGGGGCILDILAKTAVDRISTNQADEPQCLIAPLGEL